MKKILFVLLFVFVLPSVSFSQSSFESRHSLMPKGFDDVKEEENNSSLSSSNVVVVSKVEEENKSDIYAEPVIVSSDGIKVDDGNESFFLKRPVANNSSDSQNDFTTTGPKLDKPEGYDELMQMVREQGGVIKPSSYVEDRNGNLVLSSSEKKPVNVVSNVVEEKKENVVTRPLFGNSSNKKSKVKVEKKNVALKERKTPYQSVAHVASYKDRASANKGIDVFVSKYPDAGDLEPFISYEYVDGKGNLYRLYFLGGESKLSHLCREMKANGDWCNILK